MRHSGRDREPRLSILRCGVPGLAILVCVSTVPLCAQSPSQDDLTRKVEALTEAVGKAQEQVEASQRQLNELKSELNDLRRQMNAGRSDPDPQADAEQLAAQVEALKETQAMQQSQIATHDQAKVESLSKYPVKVSGLILLNGFVNTGQVDMGATPTLALPGWGSTGATMRQTVLGLDARGPHILGGSSHADVRTDFMGDTGGTGAYSAGGLLRLRTAHADVDWEHTELFFALDRPLISPTEPTSLTAVAVPPLAWSGNLWTWNPQLGVTQDFMLRGRERFRTQAALIDVANPPYSTVGPGGPIYPASTGELSRWPGVQARVAVMGGEAERGFQLGAGGYFARHRTVYGSTFDAWAGTLDYRQPLPGGMELSGNFYRGLALGGLGGGAYKDYGVRAELDHPGKFYVRPFDNVGGWAQLKERAGERLEFNQAFGMDEVPGAEVGRYPGVTTSIYQTLARTQTFVGNTIYSPSAWLQFSVEYRRLASYSEGAPDAASHIIGVGAGYKF